MFGSSKLREEKILYIIFPEHARRWTGLIAKATGFQFKA
jgi:hypothetical protein